MENTVFSVKEVEKKLQRRRGTNLVEVLGVLVVIAILTLISIGGITAARDSANETSAQSDIRTYTNALKQVAMGHPEIMKFTASRPANAMEVLLGYINDQLEEEWEFEMLPGASGSGGVATSTIKRDSWGNPYGLYVYFDDKATTYTDRSSTPLMTSDSCLYMVIVSAGKNSTGGPVGIDGNNFDTTNRKIVDAAKMVNNTDGEDDIGVILRILNGDTFSASFGLDKSTVGDLDGIYWIYGIPDANQGVLYDFDNETDKTGTASAAGSVDVYYDQLQIEKLTGNVVGTW